MIPFHKPSLGDAEAAAMLRALRQGELTGNGSVGRQVEATLRSILGAPCVLLTASCTAAMELAWMALGLKPGDQVLLPSFTFVSCATSILRSGAVPVFVDVDPETLMIDPHDLERRRTPQSRAILCVHYGGSPCDLGALSEIARHHGLHLVEDAAQALGSSLGGRPLGTIGTCGCLSFHGTKNVTSGEGGAFITSDAALADRAALMREKGTNRRAFLEGRVDKYTWVETGGSFELSDLLAAVLGAQLSRLDDIQCARHQVAQRYLNGLSELARRGRLTLPRVPDDAKPNWHVFHVLLESAAERERVRRALAAEGIETTFHFVPLHSSPYARAAFGYRPDDLPVTEDIAGRLLRLPIYPDLTPLDQDRVVERLSRLLA